MTTRVCSIEGCARKHNARGLCDTHYFRLRKFGDVLADVPVGITRSRPACSVVGCDKPNRRNGLCDTHDHHMKTRGTTDDPEPRVTPACSVEGCSRPHLSKGFCRAHLQRFRVYGDPRADIPLRVHTGHTAGGKSTPTHGSWQSMLVRCFNPAQKSYHYYGGRGITVCERWQGPGGFANFLADMGERPERKTLDRIDVNGNYEPGNCRWATWHEQALNKRPRVKA